MGRAWNRSCGNGPQDYTPLPLNEKAPLSPLKTRSAYCSKWSVLGLAVTLLGLYGFSTSFLSSDRPCDTIDEGYRCKPKSSHFWGQYSLWYSVPSDISAAPPKGCHVTFANVLSRHGGRDPTMGKSMAYALLIAQIQNTSTAYPGDFGFLKDYDYTLGADQLTDAGRQEMVYSGINFYRRYHKLVEKNTPFVRSGGQQRVVESGTKWLEGLAQSLDKKPQDIDVIIPEGSAWNNTLSHDTCPAFEGGPDHDLGNEAQHEWAKGFVPPILTESMRSLEPI